MSNRRHAVAVITVAAFALWLQAGWGGKVVTTWIDDLGEFVAAVAAALACAFASRRVTGRDRLPWALVSASCAMWAGGQLVWSWFELVSKTSPFPSLADVGFLGAIPLMLGGLFTFPRLLRGAAARVQAGVDALIIAISLLVLSWSTVLGAVYTSGADGTLALALSLVYPASDIVIITVALVLATRARARTRAPLLLVAGGVAALAVSDSSLAYTTASNTAFAVGLDWGWFGGFILIALGGLEASNVEAPAASRTPLPAVLRNVVLYLALVPAMAILAWHLVRGEHLPTVLFLSLLALTGLTSARELLALLDSTGRLRRLVGDSLTGLPGRDILRSRIRGILMSDGDHGTLLWIEVDDLAALSRRLGPDGRDLVLATMGRRLDATLEHPDVAAHAGAGHFAALIVSALGADDAIEVARRIQQALAAPIEVHGTVVSVDTTIGISPLGDAWSAESVIRGGEAAAAAGRERGGHALVMFEPARDSVRRAHDWWLPGPVRADDGNTHDPAHA